MHNNKNRVKGLEINYTGEGFSLFSTLKLNYNLVTEKFRNAIHIA